jgi:hypothetical protein
LAGTIRAHAVPGDVSVAAADHWAAFDDTMGDYYIRD